MKRHVFFHIHVCLSEDSTLFFGIPIGLIQNESMQEMPAFTTKFTCFFRSHAVCTITFKKS